MSAERTGNSHVDPLVLIRLLQVGTSLTNEAMNRYVTRPDLIDTISGILARAFRELGPIASGGYGDPCPPGYCLRNNKCEPCELIVGNTDSQSRTNREDMIGELQGMIRTLSRWRDGMA